MTKTLPILHGAEDSASPRYSFTAAKCRFDEQFANEDVLDITPVTVDGKIREHVQIRNIKGEPLEEYYKWQFITSLINSGLFAKDFIGAEVRFPKGSRTSHPLKDDKIDFYFVPTLLVENIGQQSISANKMERWKNDWDILRHCKDRDFVKNTFEEFYKSNEKEHSQKSLYD